MNTQIGSILITSGLTAAQAEEIFLLTHEVQTLQGKLAIDFIELFHSEATFFMGAQATGHENTVEERPDHSLRQRCEVTQRSGEVTWLHMNSLLFHHTLDYQRYMIQLVNHSQEAIQALHKRIWEVVRRVMESAGKSAVDGLGVALHLVDMLPTIPLQLTFNTVTAGLLGHTPKALMYASQSSIDHGGMSVLRGELIREPPSAKDEVMQAVWHVTAADTGSIRVPTTRGAGGDNIDHSGSSLSPAPRMSTSMDWHTTGYRKPCSPSYSPNRRPFWTHRSAGSRRRSNSSDSQARSFDSSLPTESVSDTKSLDDSGSPEWSRPDSPDVFIVGNADDDDPEDETISVTGFSKSDTEEVCAAATHEKAHVGDTLYAAWHDNQIQQGNDEIKQHDLRVCNHPHLGNRCEAPDQVRPPISYMEELGVFRMPVSMNNPIRLCQFYHTSPGKANILVGPKSAECARRIRGLIQIAKTMGRQHTVVVLEGESVSPWCLLGELHSRLALSWFNIHTPEEANMGICICVYCCPIYTYVIKNDTALLDHIIIGHYLGSFSCGKCLAFATDTVGKMKRHFILCRQSDMEHHRAWSTRSEVHQDSKSGNTHKGEKKKKDGVSAAKCEKQHGSPTGSNPVASSQEHAKRE